MNPDPEQEMQRTIQEQIIMLEESDKWHMDANLKVEINNFLWTHLPPDLTLAQADKIACDLYVKIQDLWESFGGTAE